MNILKISGAFLIVTLLAGCVATSVVGDAAGEDAINTVSLTCKNPYALEKDCSIWSGATRKLVIEGFDVKVAGSADGKVVLVMDAHLFRNSMGDLTLNSPTHSKASNNSYEAVKKVLLQNNVQISRVRALKSFGNVDGYIIELQSDGYTALKKYTAS